jgi:DNA-binding sugar fermentation-stimulating protein
METQVKLLQLNNLIEGEILKRPSKLIKTPYVADVVCSETKDEILGHTPALGCCGLADVGAKVLLTLNSNSKLKCSHTIYLSKKYDEIHNRTEIIGIHPKLAETLVENALNNNCLSSLRNIRAYEKEKVIYIENKVDSRFDFTGIDENGVPFIMEVKNVPLADYEDVSAKERKKMNFSGRAYDSKVAYFPDGYRKKATDPISPRALKHITELTTIKKDANLMINNNIRCIMCYVIQRTDVECFQVSILDPIYRQAVKEGVENGVEIIVMVVRWTEDGNAYFVRDDLPMTSFDEN